MPGRLGAPDAVTPAAPEETHRVAASGSQGDQQPAPRPASAQLPRPAPPRARPPPRRAPRRPHQPARPQALPGTEAAGARGRRAGGVTWRLRVPGRGQAEHAAAAAAGLLPPRARWAPGPPAPSPGAAPACAPASAPPPALGARGGCLESRAGRRVATVPRPPGSVEKARARKCLGRSGVPGPFRPAPRGGRASCVDRGGGGRGPSRIPGAASRGVEGPPPSPELFGLGLCLGRPHPEREDAGFEPLAEV